MASRKIKLTDVHRVVLGAIDDEDSEIPEVLLNAVSADCDGEHVDVPRATMAAVRDLSRAGFVRLLICKAQPHRKEWAEVPADQIESALTVFEYATWNGVAWIAAQDRFGVSDEQIEIERTRAGTAVRYAG